MICNTVLFFINFRILFQEDIVGPIEVVGKRIRVRVDGSKLHKVFLDPKDENKENVEKLDTFAEVYKRLTAKTAVFSFRDY